MGNKEGMLIPVEAPSTKGDKERERESRQEQGQSPSLDDCLKLLKGERDEQRLAGLFLDTKFCKGEDVASLRKVYDAVGVHFLDKLRTDLDSISDACENSWEQDERNLTEMVCISTCVMKTTVLMVVSGTRLAWKTTGKLDGDCYGVLNILFWRIASSEYGAITLYESGGMKFLASQMCTLPDDDGACYENGTIYAKKAASGLHYQQMPILAANGSGANSKQLLHDALCVRAGNNWPNYMRVGIVAILQNRVENITYNLDETYQYFFIHSITASFEKLHALILAESMVSIFGER
ncbi:uncharacterized protein LOC110643209 [Hevea brasiliensis]|uniref:uncharacterized protein LOC110643209 n=1 Tax=Hevea brasiliensis TaxID=3981 RepID=UPI0025EFE9DB|nr:uncharacterized protein LOC110643209 [Hevea brasiliensis]